MKYLFQYSLSVALLASTGLVSADEQSITKTINVDLGAIPTISVSASDSEVTLVVGENIDGTQNLTEKSLGYVSFSATGASRCEMEITSDYIDTNGKFLLAKSLADKSESITYDLVTSGISMAGINKMVEGAPFTSGGATVNQSWDASVEDNANGSCAINFGNPKATNFRTNDEAATDDIPSNWNGERTGNIIFTMTAI